MRRLVTIDATNTLLRLRVSPGVLYAAVAAQHGLVVSTQLAHRAFPARFGAMWTRQPNFGSGQPGGWRAWWATLVGHVLADAGCGLPPAAATASAIADRLIHLYSGVQCWTVADGVVPVLRHLRRQPDLRLGVLSNFDPRLHVLLRQLELYDYFDFVIASYEHDFCKPDVRMFELAQRTAGVEAQSCTHVGDSVQLDYRAARAAGWRAVLVGGSPPSELDPRHVCPRLDRLVDYLDEQSK